MATYAKTLRSESMRSVFILLFILQLHGSMPASTAQDVVQEEKVGVEVNELVNQLQYSKYLKEVLEVLKGDVSLIKSIDNLENMANPKLAEQLGKAHVNIRSQLDEVKRQELYRIRQITNELRQRGEPRHMITKAVKSVTKHLDLKNLDKFGTEDLRRLLLEASAELAILDQRRKETFKEYEMHKILEFRELVKRLSPENQTEVKKNRDIVLSQHRRTKPVNMPASKEHLIKVWEERDKMNRENFNTKTFFYLHDLDGNKFLDEYEIKMLLEDEVSGMFDESAPDFDPRVREEELEKMREYTFTNIDLDKDHLVSLDEFLENTKRTGFDDHIFWENVKQVPLFTDEEFAAYSELNRAEVNRLIDEGKITLDLSGMVKHDEGLEGAEKNKNK